MIKLFSNIPPLDSEPVTANAGVPRPDLKKHDREDKHTVPDRDKTNRTQPNNTPTPPSPHNSKLAFSAKALSRARSPSTKSEALLTFNSNDWLFTQSTAVCSVPVEEDGHTVATEANQLINSNGNAFSHDIIEKYYKTFVGSHNYVDHNQDPSDSRGVVVDAVLRKIGLQNDHYTYYVDLLIATSKRKDAKWAKMIEDEEVSFLSMGCISSATQCSRCGHVSFKPEEDCNHCAFDLNMYYYDKDGKKRRTAQLVTDHMDDDGDADVEFVEISYLSVDPAFSGAVRSHVLHLEPNTTVQVVVPRYVLQKEAFQVHKEYIVGVL